LTSLERGRVPSPRPIAAKEIQLIDRVEEMNLLREAVERAVRGEGGVVFLHGEAGIGKTRIARELGIYARSRGMQVLAGRCPALFRMDGVPPYVLWEEVIKDYLEVCTPEQLFRVIGSYPIEISKLVPDLQHKLRTFPQSFPLSPEHSRDRLFEAVSQFITNVSREAPLLVILDDLQWTDQSSLLLLHYLARGVYRESLLLLGAYRDTYVDKKHPLSPVLTELNRERLLQSVPLKRLSLDDVSEMIERILEQEDVSKEFCELVFEKTGGNPFFVEEVIKSLKEEQVIYREDKKWKIKEVTKIEFPETVKDVVKARIDRLSDECQHVLSLASFVGKDFTFEALQGVIGLKEDELRKIVDELLKTGLLTHRVIRGEDVCSFADIIVRDVVHEEVGTFERKKLHGVVGAALEKVYSGKIDDHLGELALHFLEGGDKDKALDYFLKAGEKAEKVYANNEAASYFESALPLLEEKGELREKGRVLERLGDIKRLGGKYDVSIKCWNDALVLWKQLGEKETVARLHRKMASVLWLNLGDSEKAKQHHEEALRILENEPENTELASLYEDMAGMVAMGATGNLTQALSLSEKAIDIAKRLSAYDIIAHSYMWAAEISVWLGNRKKGQECCERALKIALDNGYMETAVWAYDDLALFHAEIENERRLEYLEKGFELAKKVGTIEWISLIGLHLAVRCYGGIGNMSKAVSLIEESVSLNRKVGNMVQLNWSLNWLGEFFEILGETEKAEQCYDEAFSISQRLDDFQAVGITFIQRGWSHFRRGEYAKAKEFMEKGQETVEKHGARGIQWSQWTIRTYIELGECEKAKTLIDSMEEYALKENDKQLVAYAHSLGAMLLRAQKKWKESIELFEKTIQEFETLGARRWNIYNFAEWVLTEYARVYLERDQEGDREKARNLLNQALELFQKVGAKNDIEKIEAKLMQIEGRQVISEPKPVGHVATGHADLDKLMFGGIPATYAVVLTSPSCDERDLLVKTFLETGAKKGETAFYVTMDPSVVKPLAEEFPSNFYLFVCNPQADAIVKSAPNIVKLKGVENLTELGIALTSAIHKLDPSQKGSRRICLGLVSDVLLQHHAVQTRRWLTALIPELKSAGFTTLAVIDPRMHPSEEFYAILGLFEGELNLYEKETEQGLRKYLKINKMSNQKYLEDELPLKK